MATTDRAAVGEMISMPAYIDVIIPRGGKSLIERISREAKVPVIKHLDGVCHVYIDTTADPAKALVIAVNAKTHRYGTCNTMETLLVDAPVADILLPELARAYAEHQVELRGCERTRALLPKPLWLQRTIGMRSIWRRSSPLKWSMEWKRRLSILSATARTIPTRL